MIKDLLHANVHYTFEEIPVFSNQILSNHRLSISLLILRIFSASNSYQPAQKWLKDRKERKLALDDIAHYQKIIVALFETDRLMKEIYKIDIE